MHNSTSENSATSRDLEEVSVLELQEVLRTRWQLEAFTESFRNEIIRFFLFDYPQAISSGSWISIAKPTSQKKLIHTLFKTYDKHALSIIRRSNRRDNTASNTLRWMIHFAPILIFWNVWREFVVCIPRRKPGGKINYKWVGVRGRLIVYIVYIPRRNECTNASVQLSSISKLPLDSHGALTALSSGIYGIVVTTLCVHSLLASI